MEERIRDVLPEWNITLGNNRAVLCDSPVLDETLRNLSGLEDVLEGILENIKDQASHLWYGAHPRILDLTDIITFALHRLFQPIT